MLKQKQTNKLDDKPALPVGFSNNFQFSVLGQWLCLHITESLGVSPLSGNSIHMSLL